MIAYPLGVAAWRTRVLEAGSGDRAVVFLHGLGARADRWRASLDAFADAGYHCYAPDLPGHGFADKGPGFDYSVPGLARFVGSILDALGIGATVLVGTSLGAQVAGWLAAARPHQVRALVLVGATGLVPLTRPEREAIARSVRDTSREGTERKLGFVVEDRGLVSREWIEEEHRINTSPGAAETFDRFASYLLADTGIVADGVAERLAGLGSQIPTLLVWGTEDRVVPLSVGEAAARLLPDARLVVIEGAGHLPYLERAATFNTAVLEFLGCAWPAGTTSCVADVGER